MLARRKKKHKVLITTLVFLSLILGVVCIVALNQEKITKSAKQKVASLLTKQVLTEQLENIGVADIYEQIEDGDKEIVENIIGDYMTLDTVEIVKDAVLAGDLSQAQEMLTETISEEDKAKLYQLYEKYKDKIVQ